MGNHNHLEILKLGKDVWNEWRDINPVHPDFSGLNLDGMDLSGYHLDQSNFNDASMVGCNLNEAWLCWCTFFNTQMKNATILSPNRESYLGDRRLLGVNLRWSTFANANLQNVSMHGATLEGVRFHECDLRGADLSECEVFGLSAWRNSIDSSTKVDNLIITAWDEPLITVRNLELAQFIYMLINYSNIRSAIDTLTTKVILILGSFSKDDKAVLDNMQLELSKLDYIPLMYDFEAPVYRNHTETVSTLAHLSKFIIADLTNPRSIPHELATLVPLLRSVPVIPIIRDNQKPYGMFDDFKHSKNVAPIINYDATFTAKALIDAIEKSASAKIDELHED